MRPQTFLFGTPVMRDMFRITNLFVASLLLFGCSNSHPTASSFDSEKAKELLIASLDAWKQAKVPLLAKQKPPIRFVDEDYVHGMKLSEYRIVPSKTPIRPFEGVVVELSLVNRQGQTIKRQASYQVSLVPDAAVLRADP